MNRKSVKGEDNRGDRTEDRPSLGQQQRACIGERDLAAGSDEQLDAEPVFELGDGPRQRRLGDAETVGGPAEVQFLRDRDEVPKLSGLHPSTLSIPAGYRCHTELMLVWNAGRTTIKCMSEQTIALVTGANKGIGYEIAAGLGALRMSVGVGARDRQRGEEAAAKLQADP